MQVAEIELYEILKSKLGEKEARSVIEYIESKVERKFEEKRITLATKEDLLNTKSDLELKIEQVKSDLELKIEQVKSDLELKIGQLDVKIERVKSDIIKWMFLFWIGQLASLIAILQIFFRK
jgi:hypothetical protein